MKKIFAKIKELFLNLFKKQQQLQTETNKTKDDVLYVSLFLDEKSREKLLDHAMTYAPEWENSKIIAEHHTIAFYTALTEEIYDWCKKNEGKSFNVYAYEYGISDKAFAVKLYTDIPCANEIKHITVMINPDNGGVAVDSNYITDWYNMPLLPLSGNVKFIYKS